MVRLLAAACRDEARRAKAGACTMTVQTARMRGIMRQMTGSPFDFHTLFHNFCEDRVTPQW
jgi:hypothetical protein